MNRFRVTVLVREGETRPFPYLPVAVRPDYLNTVECAVFPLNYAMRVWYWLLRRDRGVLERLKPYRVEEPMTSRIKESLLARIALTGEQVGPQEAIEDALTRSNALYAVGADRFRIEWLIKDIYTGRVHLNTELERALDRDEGEIGPVEKRDDQRTKPKARRERQKKGE